MKAQVQSTYNVTDLVINKNSNSYIPQSGKIECTFHSTCTKEGFIQAKDVEYTFKVAIEFTGGTQVKVTLPSGNQFTLDIVTGEVTSWLQVRNLTEQRLPNFLSLVNVCSKI